jgi:hypothetical protein
MTGKITRAGGAQVAMAMAALVAGLVIRQRGEALFGAQTDLVAGGATGVAIGLLPVLLATAKARPRR